MLRYIEKCTGTNHNGPAWTAQVRVSKSGRTLYFNGMALKRAKGIPSGNHYDLETGDSYWVSGVKRTGSNRHWAGSGQIRVEASAVEALLEIMGKTELDRSRFRVVDDLAPTDPSQFVEVENDPDAYERFRFPDLSEDEQ